MALSYCPYCMSPIQPGQPCPSCGLTEGTYTPAAHHLPPGTVLGGRYLVGRVLGEGGFGITYIGCDLRLELRVAIKEYYPVDRVSRASARSLSVEKHSGSLGDSFESGRDRFIQEARVMARMDRMPQIVGVRDFFQENNTAYIVMEYVDGTTFKELVDQRGGKLPAGELLPMVEPLFSALSAMHALDLIHRDISPDNLMLDKGGVRLLDFGCAREAAQGKNSMTVVLKHGYSPIEQYQHKGGQGPWTDVYSLAATLYYCLTGKTPPQSLDRICDEELIPPRQLGADLTPAQERAILRGMGLRRSQRYATVEEFHAALYGQAAAPPEREEDETIFVPPEPDPGPVPPSLPEEDNEEESLLPPIPLEPASPPKRRGLLAGLAGLGAAAVILLVLLVWRPWAGESQTVDAPPTPEVSAEAAPAHSAAPSPAPSTPVPSEPQYDPRMADSYTTAARAVGSQSDQASAVAKLGELPEEALFAGAVHVTTAQEYLQYQRGERPIVIDADISASGNHTAPVLISPGVTVTTDEGNWEVDGTILVNRGTLRGMVVTGRWAYRVKVASCTVVNYGTIEANGFHHAEDQDIAQRARDVTVNAGQIASDDRMYFCGTLVNLGSVSAEGAAPTYFVNRALNFGSLTIRMTDIEAGASLVNRGAMNLLEEDMMHIMGGLWNMGAIEYPSDTAYFSLYDGGSAEGVPQERIRRAQ